MNNWYYKGHHGFVVFELETMKMMIERVLTIVDDEVASADLRFRTHCNAVSEEDDLSLDIAREELRISQTVIPRHVMNSLFCFPFRIIRRRNG